MTFCKLVFYLLLAPFMTGAIWMKGFAEKERNIVTQYLAGVLTILGAFQLFAVPFVLRRMQIDVLEKIYLCVIVLFVCISIVMICLQWKKHKLETIKQANRALFSTLLSGDSIRERMGTILLWLVFIGILFFQLRMAFRYASFDGDDAFYVAQSVMAQESGTMYEVDPYTGAPTTFDARHATATITMWIAVLARITGMHATILAHTILPLIILPTVYLVYFQIGRCLVQDEKKLPVYMIFMALLQMFGYVSLYTKETFLMTRTWQGKALAGNLVFPVLLWMLLLLAQNCRLGYILLLSMTGVVAAMCSSLAALLSCMLVGVFGLVLAMSKRSLRLLIGLGGACLPCIAYIGLFVVLH